MRRLDLIVVPYEVEREDTPMARAPRALLDAGFAQALRRAGFSTRESEVRAGAAAGREAVVGDVAHRLAHHVARTRQLGRFPVVLSGGCLAAVGTLGGLQRPGRSAAALWIDAHGDFNTPETSASGYWDGMALAVVCGRALPAVAERAGLEPLDCQRVVHLGGRDLDPPEIEAFSQQGLLCMTAVDLAGAGARERIAGRFAGAPELYLHVDLDGLDPADAPAVNMAEPEGLPAAAVASLFAALPRSAAMTFSAMNFEAADEPRRAATLATCVKLVRAAASAAG